MEIKWIGPLKGDQYYGVAQKKTAIMLHHTAGGSAREAISWWNQTPDRVGTALIIDRAGSVFQCFDLNKWAYAMGVKGETSFEKATIGIEIVSRGWLLKDGEDYYAYPNYPSLNGRVKMNPEDVIKLDKPWRGHTYFHKYNDAQIKAIVETVQYLVVKFGIQIQKDLDKFWEFDQTVIDQDKPGLWSHTTVRRDKSDIYPDPKLIKALKEAFTPIIKNNK